MRLGNLIIFREPNETIFGIYRPWVCIDITGYLYMSDSLITLLWELVTGWRKDRNIAG